MPTNTWQERITVDPEVCFGKPIIRGLRFPVSNLLEMLAGGMGATEILEDYPFLEPGDIKAALQFAAAQVSFREVIPIAL